MSHIYKKCQLGIYLNSFFCSIREKNQMIEKYIGKLKVLILLFRNYKCRNYFFSYGHIPCFYKSNMPGFVAWIFFIVPSALFLQKLLYSQDTWSLNNYFLGKIICPFLAFFLKVSNWTILILSICRIKK